MTPSIQTDLKASVVFLSMGLLMNGAAHAQTAQILRGTSLPAATAQPAATTVSTGVSQKDIEARAAAAAQKDMDPQVNGSVRDVPQLRSSK
jgi:hypothetical protein